MTKGCALKTTFTFQKTLSVSYNNFKETELELKISWHALVKKYEKKKNPVVSKQ